MGVKGKYICVTLERELSPGLPRACRQLVPGRLRESRSEEGGLWVHWAVNIFFLNIYILLKYS